MKLAAAPVVGTIPSFTATDVNTSTMYYYSGDYLTYSIVLKGMTTTATLTNDIQSFTKFDGSAEQKLNYTYSFKGSVKLTAAQVASAAAKTLPGFTAADINTSTVYYYSGDYLQYSVVLKGMKTIASINDEIQSFTEFDGSSDQKM